MRKLLFVAVFVILAGTFSLPSPHRTARATGSGPTIAVGGPSLVSGKVQAPILAWYPVTDAYSGFSVHLRWSATVFSLSSTNATGGPFDPGANPATGVCAGPNTTTFDSDGGGMVFSCSGFSGTTQSFRLLATVILTPAASGCSALHLYTYGAPDNGDATSGTYTINAADGSVESNQYLDGTANVSGQSCSPNAPSSSSTSSPGPTAPTTFVSCIYDLAAVGAANGLGLNWLAAAFPSQAGQTKFGDGRADLNADDFVNGLDLNRFAVVFTYPVTGCAPEYPYYPPGAPSNWDGTLPGGYQWSQYLLFLGAMTYLGTSPCPWAFVSASTQTYLNECTVVVDLEGLADHLHLARPGLYTQVFVGPNDCTDLFTQPPANQSIGTAAGILTGAINAANVYSRQNNDGVVFYAEVDDEAYRIPVGGSFCGTSDRAYQYPNTLNLFQSYVFVSVAAGYINPSIGPAGAPQMTSTDEANLASAGDGGLAIPQIYSYLNAQALRPGGGGCTIDGYGPADGSWPYTIANGYEGIQSDLPYGNKYSSWQGNIRWSICHDAPPGSNFDWYVPGGRG